MINDNHSYKTLCLEGQKLYKENKELKSAVKFLKKEKYYWIPITLICSFVSFVSGTNIAKDKLNQKDLIFYPSRI